MMGCERLLAYIIPVSAALPHDYFPVLLMVCRIRQLSPFSLTSTFFSSSVYSFPPLHNAACTGPGIVPRPPLGQAQFWLSDASSPDRLYLIISESTSEEPNRFPTFIHHHTLDRHHRSPHVHHTFRRVYRSSRAGQGRPGHRRLRARLQDRLGPRMGDRPSVLD